jgi:integrase
MTTNTVTIGALLDEWFTVKRGSFSVTTRATNACAIRFLKADFGPVGANALRTRHVDRWVAGMEQRGYSAAYTRRLQGVLSAALTKGVTWEICETNVVKNAEKPRNRSKVKPATPEAIKAALDWCLKHKLWLFAFLRLAAMSGARRSELLGLRREDFVSDLGQVTIRRVCVPGEHGTEVVDATKSARGARTISLDALTCDAIEKHLASHESPWLFPARYNPSKPMHPTSVTHATKKVGDMLGVKLHPHALRHHCATTGLRSGIGLNVIAGRLGDAPATVMRTYAHVVPADDRQVADMLAASIS